jgi:DNA-directed RNA polymerase subunit RPC12/RpoP
MLVYSNPVYISDNGNGYSLDVRDVICSNCGKVIDRQEKYRNIYKDFAFSENEKEQWKFCPYCGEKLYK